MVKSVKYRQFTDEEDVSCESANNQLEDMSNTPSGPPPNYKASFNNHIELTTMDETKKVIDTEEDDELTWYIDNYEANPGKLKLTLRDAMEQLIIIFHLGAPICIEKFSSFFPGFMLLIFYGQIGPDEISGAGFGFMYGNVTGISIVIGFALGLPPLAAQAFGAQNYVRCGDLLQRTLAIHLIVIVPIISILWLNTESMLLALGQPPNIVEYTAEFLYWRLPAIPFMCVAEDISYFLKAQRVMVPTMVMMIVSNIASVVLAAFFILPQYNLELGFKGGPLALTIANICQCLFLLMFGKSFLLHKSTWPVWSLRNALSGWGEVLAMAVPSALGMWGEWWAFETSMFLSGFLCSSDDDVEVASLYNITNDNHTVLNSFNSSSTNSGVTSYEDDDFGGECLEVEVYSIVSNTMIMVYLLSGGFSWGASTHVGNLLGAGDHRTAALCCRVLLVLVFFISGSLALTLLLLRHEWGALFSDSVQVQEMIAKLLFFVAGYIVIDALTTGALASLLRASGVVNWPAFITMFAFYGIGIPLGSYLTFGPPYMHSIYSLWLGLFVGMSWMLLGLIICYCCLDFEQAAKDAKKRSAASGGGSDSVDGGLSNAAITPLHTTGSSSSSQKRKSIISNVLALTNNHSLGNSNGGRGRLHEEDDDFDLDDDEMEDVLRDLEVAIQKADSYQAPSRNLCEEEFNQEDDSDVELEDNVKLTMTCAVERASTSGNHSHNDSSGGFASRFRTLSQSSDEYFDVDDDGQEDGVVDGSGDGPSEGYDAANFSRSPSKHVYNKLNMTVSRRTNNSNTAIL